MADDNRQAWTLWARHDLKIVSVLRTGSKVILRRRLDYPAIHALMQIYGIDQAKQADTLERLEWLFHAQDG